MKIAGKGKERNLPSLIQDALYYQVRSMRVMLTVQVHTIYSYQNELQKLILSVLLCQLCCALNLSQYQFLYCPTLHNKVLSSFFNKLRVLLLIVKKLQVVIFLADWVFLALFVVNDLKGNGLEVQDSEDVEMAED